LHFAVGSSDAAVAAGDVVWFETRLEGLRVADLKFGSASAKTVTLQFGVMSQTAGTYCVSLRSSGAGNRAYVAEYTIAAGEVNTDVVKSVTIPGDVAGTWVADNTAAFSISWMLMCGSTYQTPAGSWVTGNYMASANQINFMAGAPNTAFQIFDISLTEGTSAPAFVVPDYVSELAWCQRYWRQFSNMLNGGYGLAGGVAYYGIPLVPPMRVTPTLTYPSPAYSNASGIAAHGATNAGVYNFSITVTTTNSFYVQATHNLNARL
jgi:hypothetical protein